MPIVTPGKRPGVRMSKSRVFGKKGSFGKKAGGYASLNLTPMVDMFTIIVIYLLQSFSSDGDILLLSKEIQLPSITAKLKIDRAPIVAVSAETISVDGARVVDVSQLMQDMTVVNVPELEEVMREKKRVITEQKMMMGDTEGFKGVVNVQADKGVKFGILKKVMFSCNTAGFGNINFAGLQVSQLPPQGGP